MFTSLGNSIPRNGLVGEWLLDGNANDTSGNGLTGTNSNGVYVKSNRGYVNKCWQGNGSNSIIETSTNILPTLVNNCSLSAWVYHNSNSTQQTIFSNGNNGTGGDIGWYFGIKLDGVNNTYNFTKPGVINENTGITPTLGVWQYITFKIVGYRGYLYINGNLVWTGSNTNTISNNTQSTKIGANKMNGSVFQVFNGNIQGVRAYNRVLSQDEIQLLYLEGQKLLGPTNIAKYPKLFEGLVGYWDFKGTAHNLVDGVAGTVTGATLTTDRFGNSNSAYNFDGTDDYITLPSTLTSLQNLWTYSFIIKTSQTTPAAIYSRWVNSSSQRNIHINLVNGKVGVDVPYIASIFSSNSTINNGLFHFVSITRNGNSWSIYIDGILDNSTTNSTSQESNTSASYIGTDAGTLTQDFNGVIDMFLTFNRALSADEVKLLYNLTSQDYIYPTPSYDLPNLRDGIIADYNNSYNGTTYYDNSGNGYNLNGTNITNIRQGRSKVVGLLTANNGSNIISNVSHGVIPSTPITINKWVKTGYTGTYGLILLFDIPAPYNLSYVLTAHSGTYQIDAVRNGTAEQRLNSGISVDANKWRMITGTFNNGSYKIYIDGVLMNSGTYSTSPGSYNTTSAIRGYFNYGSGHTNYQGQTRIINGILSDKQIQELYYSQKGNYIY